MPLPRWREHRSCLPSVGQLSRSASVSPSVKRKLFCICLKVIVTRSPGDEGWDAYVVSESGSINDSCCLGEKQDKGRSPQGGRALDRPLHESGLCGSEGLSLLS